MSNLSNTLADLAEQVKAANEAVLVAQRTSIEGAMNAGRLLVQAKDECKHGEWLPFLTRAGINDRTAQRFMTLARSGLQIRHVSDLGGIKAALEFLSKWSLPAFGETVAIIRKDAVAESVDEDAHLKDGVAYIFESQSVPQHYEIVVFRGDFVDRTKRPMWGVIHAKDELPVNTVIYWLTLHFEVPIDEWHIEIISPRLPDALLNSGATT